MSLKVIIVGAKGRMGKTLLEVASDCEGLVIGTLDEGDALESAPWAEADVAIDFSFHAATPDLLKIAYEHSVPVVIGTTGHTPQELEAIKEFGERLPLTHAGNYSIGVNLLFHLTRVASRTLESDYVPEILELHHKHKMDAPSGTALNLADAVSDERDLPDSVRVFGRSGETGPRGDKTLGIHAIRGGEIIGEHTVFFIGDSDRIELTHRASDRGIYARGAYRAAHWLKGRKPGLYSMMDVLDLND